MRAVSKEKDFDKAVFPASVLFTGNGPLVVLKMKEGSRSTANSSLSLFVEELLETLLSFLCRLSCGLSDVVLRVSMLWPRCWNWEDEFYETHRLNKQSLFLWKLLEYCKNTVDTKKEI